MNSVSRPTTIVSQWSHRYTGFHIAGIDLRVRRGELVAVVGPVGGGKSMLLQAILGETATVTGRCGCECCPTLHIRCAKR
jgi:ABC-type branched-subunit amino acid transport system ATPase component